MIYQGAGEMRMYSGAYQRVFLSLSLSLTLLTLKISRVYERLLTARQQISQHEIDILWFFLCKCHGDDDDE
jgi:hypothetical protein